MLLSVRLSVALLSCSCLFQVCAVNAFTVTALNVCVHSSSPSPARPTCVVYCNYNYFVYSFEYRWNLPTRSELSVLSAWHKYGRCMQKLGGKQRDAAPRVCTRSGWDSNCIAAARLGLARFSYWQRSYVLVPKCPFSLPPDCVRCKKIDILAPPRYVVACCI
jgi:hypothetical protein